MASLCSTFSAAHLNNHTSSSTHAFRSYPGLPFLSAVWEKPWPSSICRQDLHEALAQTAKKGMCFLLGTVVFNVRISNGQDGEMHDDGVRPLCAILWPWLCPSGAKL